MSQLEADTKDKALGFRPYFCSGEQFLSDQLRVLLQGGCQGCLQHKECDIPSSGIFD